MCWFDDNCKWRHIAEFYVDDYIGHKWDLGT